MFYDNLSAHLDPEVKQIFGSNKVFLCYLSPKMTNFIQVIDAGLGRSVQLDVGRFLGEWIMGSDNMTVWEGEMTACERRILITIFVSKDPAYVMGSAMESMRVGCFELIGCIITMLPNDVHNSKTNPQGMPIGSFTVPKVGANDE